MKMNYKCDSKLKIYDHISFYEQNLRKAKKLYLPHINKNKIKSNYGMKSKLYQSGNKMNIGAMLKQYGNDYDKITKKKVFDLVEEENKNERNFEEEEEGVSVEEFEMKKRKVMDMFDDFCRKEEDNEQCDLDDIIKRVNKGESYLKNKDNEKDYEMRIKGETPEEEEEEEEEEDDEYNDEFEKSETNNNNVEKVKKEIKEFDVILVEDLLKCKNNDKDDDEIQQFIFNLKEMDIKYDEIYNKDNNNDNDKQNDNDNSNEKKINDDDDINKSKSQHNDDNNNNDNDINVSSHHSESNIFDNTDKSFSISESDINNINRELFKDKTIPQNSSSMNDNRDQQAYLIQSKYRKHRDEINQPFLSNKIYSGWNDDSTHSIFLYIYKEDNNNVVSLYAKVYSLTKQKKYDEVFTIPELNSLQIVNKQVISIKKAKEESKEIAMRILKLFYKVIEMKDDNNHDIVNMNDKEEIDNNDLKKEKSSHQSENKSLKYEEEYEMVQKSQSMEKFKEDIKENFEIHENSNINEEADHNVIQEDHNSNINQEPHNVLDDEEHYNEILENRNRIVMW
jgi:hypothetical protein